MKPVFNILILVGIFFQCSDSYGDLKSFGSPITLKDSIAIESALSDYPSHSKNSKNEILIKGKVNKVCKKSGCWMSFRTSQGDVRVTFKDYGFFVPESILNQNIIAQGVLTQRTLSLKDTRHYAKDEGLSPSEIEKIITPKKEFAFIASGVMLQN